MCCETFKSNIIFFEWVWVLKKLSVPQVGYFFYICWIQKCPIYRWPHRPHPSIAWSHVSDKTRGVAQWECWQSGGATGNAHWEEGLYTSPWQAGLSRQGSFKEGIVCVVTILELSDCIECVDCNIWMMLSFRMSGCHGNQLEYTQSPTPYKVSPPKKNKVVVHWKGDERFFSFFLNWYQYRRCLSLMNSLICNVLSIKY